MIIYKQRINNYNKKLISLIFKYSFIVMFDKLRKCKIYKLSFKRKLYYFSLKNSLVKINYITYFKKR